MHSFDLVACSDHGELFGKLGGSFWEVLGKFWEVWGGGFGEVFEWFWGMCLEEKTFKQIKRDSSTFGRSKAYLFQAWVQDEVPKAF